MQLQLIPADSCPTLPPRDVLETEARRMCIERITAAFVTMINNQPTCLIGKNPWEMTRSVWESTIEPVSKAYAASISTGEAVAKVFLDRYGYTHNGYAFRPSSVSNSRHDVQVAFAFLRGDHVPAEVACEYSKEYWKDTYDLREYEHLPRYVSTADERREAIECWEKRKAHVEMVIKDKFFNYQSEADLKHHAACIDRILSELAHE